MSLVEKLLSGEAAVCVVGMGYVGLPLAVAFARKGVRVIGFDTDTEKVNMLSSGVDPTAEVGAGLADIALLEVTADPRALERAQVFLVTVPTPADESRNPDLSCIRQAMAMIGARMPEGAVVVLESTVYPGVTEEVCLPILEQASGFACGRGFKLGYSPERSNPGDRVHHLGNIPKIVSGCDDEAVALIRGIYEIVVEAGAFPVSSIRTAEAIKVAENCQRDVNIAFMNELAMLLHEMDVDTGEVVEGMNTKWNALGFRPGLVGGHCIGVDPYYLRHAADRLGCGSRVISVCRDVNESMAGYVADTAAKTLCAMGKTLFRCRVAVLGVTFKENCPDTRNSQAVRMVRQLEQKGVTCLIADPVADAKKVCQEYGMELLPLSRIRDVDCVIVAVAHDEYRELTPGSMAALFGNRENPLLMDVKGIFPRDWGVQWGIRCWRL